MDASPATNTKHTKQFELTNAYANCVGPSYPILFTRLLQKRRLERGCLSDAPFVLLRRRALLCDMGKVQQESVSFNNMLCALLFLWMLPYSARCQV